jgi:protein translocase SecG subunit
MQHILSYTQVGSAVLLIITILLQQRGQGLGSGIGGSGMEYSTKRGIEKGVFYATIVLTVIFIGVSIARLIIG